MKADGIGFPPTFPLAFIRQMLSDLVLMKRWKSLFLKSIKCFFLVTAVRSGQFQAHIAVVLMLSILAILFSVTSEDKNSFILPPAKEKHDNFSPDSEHLFLQLKLRLWWLSGSWSHNYIKSDTSHLFSAYNNFLACRGFIIRAIWLVYNYHKICI